jgi:hypothetical protein
MEKIEIGDSVSFVNETGFGFVSEIKSNGMVLVADEDGFEREYPLKELILKDSSDSITYEKSFSDHIDKDRKRRKSKAVVHTKDLIEVDLHIEELVDDHRGWSNAEILIYQIEKFEKVLNKAFQIGTKKIIVVHGRGDGVLRYEIRRKLRDYPGIEVYDASYKNYGQGATEILLRR